MARWSFALRQGFLFNFYISFESTSEFQAIDILAATTTTAYMHFRELFRPTTDLLPSMALYLNAPGYAVTEGKCTVKLMWRRNVVAAPVSSRPPPAVSRLLAFLPAH